MKGFQKVPTEFVFLEGNEQVPFNKHSFLIYIIHYDSARLLRLHIGNHASVRTSVVRPANSLDTVNTNEQNTIWPYLASNQIRSASAQSAQSLCCSDKKKTSHRAKCECSYETRHIRRLFRGFSGRICWKTCFLMGRLK